jgi:5-methylcytosine-specific restriction protein A
LAESPEEGLITCLRDLAIVCSNCHRMLHRSPDYPSIESLRNRVRHARGKAHRITSER